MNYYDRKISCFLNVWNISESEIFLHSVFPCEDFKLTILIGFCFQLIISVPFHIKKKNENKLSSGLLSALSQIKRRKIEFPVIRLDYARRQLFYSSLWSELRFCWNDLRCLSFLEKRQCWNLVEDFDTFVTIFKRTQCVLVFKGRES